MVVLEVVLTFGRETIEKQVCQQAGQGILLVSKGLLLSWGKTHVLVEDYCRLFLMISPHQAHASINKASLQ